LAVRDNVGTLPVWSSRERPSSTTFAMLPADIAADLAPWVARLLADVPIWL
jgi:hypothetical protein